MKFSIIMPSRLVDYPGAARQRDQKLLRAVRSVQLQKYEDWELHIIADGCQKTIDLINDYVNDSRILLWQINHIKLWSGAPRNKGIDEATGDYIIYLDIDDIYGLNHLNIINNNIKKFDWVWYNDYRYKPKNNFWYENECDINILGRHGTSNICHRRSLGVHWNVNDKYAHDYNFIRKLFEFKNYTKILTPEYYVCHVPGGGLSGGYDI